MDDPWKAYVPGYKSIAGAYGEMTGNSLLRGRVPETLGGRPER